MIQEIGFADSSVSVGTIDPPEKVFREKITGTTADRLQLRKLIAALSDGDIVIHPGS
jgi:hypothetical protein